MVDFKRAFLWAGIGLIITIIVVIIVVFAIRDGANDNGDCNPDCKGAKVGIETDDGCGGKCAALKCDVGETQNENGTCSPCSSDGTCENDCRAEKDNCGNVCKADRCSPLNTCDAKSGKCVSASLCKGGCDYPLICKDGQCEKCTTYTCDVNSDCNQDDGCGHKCAINCQTLNNWNKWTWTTADGSTTDLYLNRISDRVDENLPEGFILTDSKMCSRLVGYLRDDGNADIFRVIRIDAPEVCGYEINSIYSDYKLFQYSKSIYSSGDETLIPANSGTPYWSDPVDNISGLRPPKRSFYNWDKWIIDLGDGKKMNCKVCECAYQSGTYYFAVVNVEKVGDKVVGVFTAVLPATAPPLWENYETGQVRINMDLVSPYELNESNTLPLTETVDGYTNGQKTFKPDTVLGNWTSCSGSKCV